MPKLKHVASAICLFIFMQISNAQLGFSHEIGAIAGYVELRSDFGESDDSFTNFNNSGIGIGFVHYLNFTYRANCNCYTADNYFNDHFKLRNEISWNKTKLEHHGEWVQPYRTSADADKLRAHTGVANNFDIGTQIEFFPLSIRDFQSFANKLAPFVSLGVHYTFYTPEVKTTYANPDPSLIGDITDPSNFYSQWDFKDVDSRPGSTWSLVSSIGVRYKLTQLSDLMLDIRGQMFFTDHIDGLNHDLNSNKSNDWLIWFNIGYIVYL